MSAAAPSLLDRLVCLYPVLGDSAPPGWVADVARMGPVMQVPVHTVLFDEGSPCLGFPMVLSGAVQVARGAPQGRALELYRVQPGEVCVVSAACLFGGSVLSAHGVAVQATELLVLSPGTFMRWSEHEPFRRFVFGQFATRLSDLMALTEAVAFQRLDQRLAGTLLGRGQVLHLTHQQLADELGTVREMVTRLLKRFEQAGWVRLGRERIELLEASALRQLSAGPV
ncbi:CRP/FNR family transcriptional regulator [Sphaerotilus hippei]|uniref:CRP/FNR family transcriptional regulator n=1 Tax=Sphaerotilus hippei TaxID=744406 RepID=A0A318H6J4_9BURK|nr:Crp/Fnr family transcriptional regulator [Sphaerotilus hippei]PXW99495.1 CRP/FNR family transcriptional regulator [Sphaerotilus hippei]